MDGFGWLACDFWSGLREGSSELPPSLPCLGFYWQSGGFLINFTNIWEALEREV